MEKETLVNKIISCKSENILCVLPTGYGKSKLALDILKGYNKILIVVPRLVLIDSWKDEIVKWCAEHDVISFVTYNSLHKKVTEEYDGVIYDECHHLSDRCLDIIPNIKTKKRVFLSATVSMTLRFALRNIYKDLACFAVRIREAIEDKVLPDPEVLLYPLELDDTINRQQIIINPKASKTIVIDFNKGGAKYLQMRNVKEKVIINCTDKMYSNHLNTQILKYKNLYYRTHKQVFMHSWQRLCLERLKYLSNIKTNIVKQILNQYKDKRTLTLCNSIEQTEQLGTYCIHSKNKEAMDILDKFNNGEINHITACDMLNEGINLVNCEIGIFANLNGSETRTLQRIGRLLRHEHPKLIIPYYIHTREEEIVEEMKQNYNKDLIKVIEL